MAKPANGTIIIKKIKKGGHGGHHGGAWKVAYADFVTAMMAFFLLLWLLNVTTDVQKRGIADYFDPTIALRSDTSGSGKILGGQSLGKPGNLTETTAAVITMPIPSDRQPNDGEDSDAGGSPQPADNPADAPAAAAGAKPDAGDGAKPDAGSAPGTQDPPRLDHAKPSETKLVEAKEEAAEKALAAKEEQRFNAAEFALRQAIQDVPELKNLAQNLIIDRTPEGLRIQIVDQDKYSMFPLGSADMVGSAKELMGLVAKVVSKLPNKISVTGHTDATPFANKSGTYGNWELSSDRANASRRALIAAGLSPERIAKVVGEADRDPLVAGDPTSPRNRRISIVLLRTTQPPPGKLAQR